MGWLELTTTGATAAAWHHRLSLADQGYWPMRLPVTIRNLGDPALAGDSVEVPLAALAGTPVAALRVCRGDGVELLYDLRSSAGNPKRSGLVEKGDRMIVPVECPGQGQTTVYLYAGNTRAWTVPDFLPGGFHNGDFEQGAEEPSAWETASTDEVHLLSWEAKGGRHGSRGAKAEVAPGAPATWVQWRQDGIRIAPGRTYRLTGWVRAEEVSGQAGWYVHVNGARPQLINRTLNAGAGSFDWREVTTTFTAPSDAQTAVVGTVLHGTGRAWYDEVTLAAVEGAPPPDVSLGAIERLELDPPPIATATDPDPVWSHRAVVRVRNFSNQAASPTLVRINLRSLLARLPGVGQGAAVRVVPLEDPQPVIYRLGTAAELMLGARVPARAERDYEVAFGPAHLAPAQAPNSDDTSRLLQSEVNQVPAASFEEPGAVEAFWGKPAAGSSGLIARLGDQAHEGSHCLELTVPDSRQSQWTGWHSKEIPVQPGATYWLSGWLQAAGLQGSATIHAHFHRGDGALTSSGAMVSTRPQVSGHSDWTLSTAFLTAPPDAATIQLHLTMNTSGTLRHDGLLLCPILESHVEKYLWAGAGLPKPKLHVWEVNPLIKIFPDSLPPEKEADHAPLKMEMAQGEYEPLQLALRWTGSDQGVNGAQVVVSELRHASGRTLPEVKVEQVGYVPIDQPSAYYSTDVPDWCRQVPRGGGVTDGWAGWWPDPLLPMKPFELAADHTQSIWITVRTFRDTPPGRYAGEITIRAEGMPERKLPWEVEVLPFALPETTRLRAIFDFRRGRGGWFGPDPKSPGAYRKWLKFLAAHRLGIDQIEPPPRFSYEDGRVKMDASGFDETARYCFEELGMNVSYTPWTFYMFGWAYPPKKWFGLEPFTLEWAEAFRQAYGLFADHVRQRGWLDRFVYYISDEPHFDHEFVVNQMRRLCALIHDVEPALPIYSSTWRHCPPWDESLDIWGVGQYGCFPVEEMERLQRAGRRFWFTCDGQMATDTPYLATERMLPYYCFRYGVEGFEFWGVSWWTYNPWERGWHSFIRQSNEGENYYWVRYPNGDGYLAYPGEPVGVDGPVSTIRLEQVREGLEDYEVFCLLTDQVKRARQEGRDVSRAEQALAQARAIAPIPNSGGLRSTEILPDPERIPTIRRAVNKALVDLLP